MSGSADRRRLRVLVVIKCLGHGGAERLLVDSVAAGDRESFHYEVAHVLTAESALAPTVRAGGTPVHDLGATANWDLRWLIRFRRLLQAGRFDVVHFHLPYTASLGRLVVASMPRTGRPAVVYTEHSLWNKMAVLIRVLNRATIGLDRSLIVVSQAAHDALPRSLRARSRMIVHGVDLSRSEDLVAQREQIRKDVRSELGLPDDDLLVLTVANLRPEKGYETLLAAAAVVVGRSLPIRFVAVGRGPLEGQLRARLHQLALGDRFRLLGHRDDVLRLLVGADVFVLPSDQEGLPVSLMEAASVGLPIVATAVGGVPQAITDGTDGLVIPPRQPAQLADALERLAADGDLRHRLGRGARDRSTMFDVTSATREIEGIYRQVAG